MRDMADFAISGKIFPRHPDMTTAVLQPDRDETTIDTHI